MFTLSVDECDLIDFFGAEHICREYGTEWFDSDSLYEHQRPDGLTLTCAVHPIHKDARITLSFNGHVCYDWQATALVDIIHDREQKRLCFKTQAGDTLTLRISPQISVLHECLFRRE